MVNENEKNPYDEFMEKYLKGRVSKYTKTQLLNKPVLKPLKNK